MRIGFIGLGTMGRGMAESLQKGGHELVVHDIREEAAREFIDNGAIWAATPRAVAEQTQLVMTSLPAPPDVEAVAFGENGLASGFSPGDAWFDMTTNSVTVVRRICAKLAEQGVDFLDSPVSGHPGHGLSAIWVGGDEAVFDRYRPTLAEMTAEPSAVRRINDIGAATIAKLSHSMAYNGIIAVLSEVLTTGAKAGLQPDVLWETIRDGATGRERAFDICRWFIQGPQPPGMQMRLAFKDVSLALELARDVNVPMKVCNLVGLELNEALNRDLGRFDSDAFTLLQQERAGVEPFAVGEERVSAIMERSH